MNDLDKLIQDLEYDLGLWEEEYNAHGPNGSKRSRMSKRNLNFLRMKIDAAKAMKAKIDKFIHDTRESVQSHKDTF